MFREKEIGGLRSSEVLRQTVYGQIVASRPYALLGARAGVVLQLRMVPLSLTVSTSHIDSRTPLKSFQRLPGRSCETAPLESFFQHVLALLPIFHPRMPTLHENLSL